MHSKQSRELLSTLPFVRALPDGEYDFWSVPSDDDAAGELRGRRFGAQFIEALLSDLSTSTLTEIVQAMPRPLSALEHGFLRTVAHAIAVPPNIAVAAVRVELSKRSKST